MPHPDHPILFIPGPVEVSAPLREIMAMPLMGHRSKPFVAEVKAVCGKLPMLFRTASAFTGFENCPATALMEAAVRNLVSERILHLTNGAFSERWAKISTACGRRPEVLAVDWGEANPVETLRDKLQSSPPFEAVAVTHSETSTGVLNPVRDVAAAVRELSPDTLILVDSVTSLGGAELEFDDWGIDLAFAGTQKCLALPPGLCVYAVSQRAMARAEQIEGRGFLLDFLRARDGLAEGKTLATPCVPLTFALSRQLDNIAAEGIEQRWARHREMQDITAAWAAENAYELFIPDPAFRSPTVTTVRNSGREVAELIERAAAAGFVLGNGYGKLKGETFRIGHMGDHRPETLRELLAAIA